MAVKSREAYERQQRRRFRRGGTSASMAPTVDALRALWAAAHRPIDQLVLVLGGRWGLWNDEIRHFNRTWWNDAAATIVIPGACGCGVCDALYLTRRTRWTPKTVCGERSLNCSQSPGTIETIRRFLDEREGVYYSSRGIERIVERLYRRAALPRPRAETPERLGIIVHGLRAAAAMRLALEIDNPLRLCFALGWSDLTVARHYVSVAHARGIRVGPDLWEEPDAKRQSRHDEPAMAAA